MFDRSKLESLHDVSVTRIGDTLSYGFPQTVLFCGPAHTDSLWPSLTRAKSGQAQIDASQNGPASQAGLEQIQFVFTVIPFFYQILQYSKKRPAKGA